MNRPTIFSKFKALLAGTTPGENAVVAPVVAAPGETVSPAAPAAPAAAAPLDTTDSRIPRSSVSRVERIRSLVREIETQAGGTTGGKDALEEARRIETIYLPKLVYSYFDIGEEHRVEVFRATGRSASFMLNDRLDTLIAQLLVISQGFARGRIDAFSINLGFIDKRFGSTDSPFDDQ